MLTKNAWRVSTTVLLDSFRSALIALVPIAEGVHMPWREPDNYDDWDAMAAAVYQSIVIASIESATADEPLFPLPAYDGRLNTYHERSFISSTEFGETYAFVCFETNDRPFDTALFARLDQNGVVVGLHRRNVADTTFTFVGRKNGSSAVRSDLDVVL